MTTAELLGQYMLDAAKEFGADSPYGEQNVVSVFLMFFRFQVIVFVREGFSVAQRLLSSRLLERRGFCFSVENCSRQPSPAAEAICRFWVALCVGYNVFKSPFLTHFLQTNGEEFLVLCQVMALKMLMSADQHRYEQNRGRHVQKTNTFDS